MSPTFRLVILRLALGSVTLFVVSVIVFGAVRLLPGDIAQQLLGQSGTPETIAALRGELGLDVPAHTQYFHWLFGVLGGDFGHSIATRRDIAEIVGPRLQKTLILASFAAVIGIPVGLLLGFLAALLKGSPTDRSINLFSLVSISFPEFFIAYTLVVIFSIKLGWLPSISRISPDMPLSSQLDRLILPALTLSLVIIGYIARVTRAAISNVLGEAFIQMARLKGLSRWRLVLVHAAPNALGPIINVVAITLAYLVVGVVIVETVFAYPGLGQLLVDSVVKRDMPVVQAACLIFASVYILINIIADVLIILCDPRLRHTR